MPPKVAIVGGGLSNLVAATELLRAGIEDITLFDSCDASLWIPYGDNQCLVASFGVMPFLANQICLAHHLNKLRIAINAGFPIAGKDDIVLYYRRKRYTWCTDQAPPSII